MDSSVDHKANWFLWLTCFRTFKRKSSKRNSESQEKVKGRLLGALFSKPEFLTLLKIIFITNGRWWWCAGKISIKTIVFNLKLARKRSCLQAHWQFPKRLGLKWWRWSIQSQTNQSQRWRRTSRFKRTWTWWRNLPSARRISFGVLISASAV